MIELPKLQNGSRPDQPMIDGDINMTMSSSPPPSSKSRIIAVKIILMGACIASAAYFASTLKKGSTNYNNNNNSNSRSQESIRSTNTAHLDLDTFQPLAFHQSGFGALNFNQHSDAQDRYRRMLSSSSGKVVIPKSAVPDAIPSLGERNIINAIGHYLHDEHRSPFASPLYVRPAEELAQEQAEYLEKMNKVRQEWGSWNFKDHMNVVRPVQDFSTQEYKDLPNSAFTDNVWQKDETYVKDLIAEGRKLVDRMTEGIYAEYGHPTKKADGSVLSAEEMEDREKLFAVHTFSDATDAYAKGAYPEGWAKISEGAFDGLVRKLLHGMITNDEFYFVLGGHSAAAGHGNDFQQQKTMQFQNIMDPVFHKLGMRLISRNMAMGGLGTLHFSGGMAELYGEADFLMWDSAMTENYNMVHDIDLFNKQAILKGERVPIIFTLYPNNIMTETRGKAWIGDMLIGLETFPKTTDLIQGRTLPWATQFQSCAEGVNLCGANQELKFNSVCWVERTDFEATVKIGGKVSPLNAKPSGQASWHPGWRWHQFESRKTALVFLKAFKKAFDVWEQGIEQNGHPLKESYWHVGDTYKDIQDTLHTYINGEGKGTSVCEKRYEPLNMDKWCRVKMHGMSEFRPINLGKENGIIKHVKPSPSGHVPQPRYHSKYSGPDILPLGWKIPEDDVDLHAIAIATSYEAPQIDHFWEDKGEDDDFEEDGEDSRRQLRSLGGNSVEESIHGSHSVDKVNNLRVLDSGDIVPGEGWDIEFHTSPEEYCDGSAQSECHRIDEFNPCLYYGNNDMHNGIAGDGLSGWLVINVPEVKEGIIWAKMEWWHPRKTWYMSGGLDDDDLRRNLGNASPYPDDVIFEIAINGKIYDSWDKDKFMSNAYPELAYNQAIYRFVTDESVSGEVELGLRISSESDPKQAGLSVTHIYYS